MTHDAVPRSSPRASSVVLRPSDQPTRDQRPETDDQVWAFPPRRILVPVDFGDASARAVAVAGVLANRFGATMTALHADTIEAPVYFTHEQAAAVEVGRNGARAVAERELMQFVRRVTLQPARVRFVEDSPANAIVEAARGADLIVMGTHGRRGPTRWWLGSVAERIVREATVPVLVVRAARDGDATETLFRRPLVVAGAWAFDGEAARYAGGLADAFGGTVAERTASCQEDLVRERDATLLVVPDSPAVRSGWFGTPAEKLIRSCTLPMLFVPQRQEQKA